MCTYITLIKYILFLVVLLVKIADGGGVDLIFVCHSNDALSQQIHFFCWFTESLFLVYTHPFCLMGDKVDPEVVSWVRGNLGLDQPKWGSGARLCGCTVIRALVYELWFEEVRPVVVGTRLGVKSWKGDKRYRKAVKWWDEDNRICSLRYGIWWFTWVFFHGLFW